MKDNHIKLMARWEHDEIPAGKATKRGLLIDVSGRRLDDDARAARPSLNLAIVIDRSGSMRGERLAAAREAAIGISQRLRRTDLLSVVAYDDKIDVLLEGVPQDEAGQEAARAVISQLKPRGSTDLGGGWMMGAKCVAEVMERHDFSAGHVLTLSDGHANHGVTDPAVLAEHAGEMAARGVTSSCVGIGNGYSPLQLDAIAEAGHGQLHHSDTPDEIVEVVLGELGDLTHVAGHSVRLELRAPGITKPQQLTRFREESIAGLVKLDLGDIPGGITRKVAFMVNLDQATEPGQVLPFMMKLSWKDDSGSNVGISRGVDLKVVDSAAFNPQAKNKEVARTIAELWLARMGYEAMALNERGLFREAVETFVGNDVALDSLIAELEDKDRQLLLKRKMSVQNAVANEWSGPSKLEAFMLAKKFVRSEGDHSGRSPKDWSDRAPK